MADSVNYQHFITLVGAYERAHPEKNKNAAQPAVGKVWKKMKTDFPAADELEEEVKRQANKWKTLSFTEKSKMTGFWSKAVQKEKLKVTNESLPAKSQQTTESVIINDKTNSSLSAETPPSTTNTAAPTPAQEKVKQNINIKNDILVGLYQNRDFGQLSQSDRCESTRRRKKQKEAPRKRQQKFHLNQKLKI